MSPQQRKRRNRKDGPGKTRSIAETPGGPGLKDPGPSDKIFPVVALGASAGGLEAFTQFLSQFPGNSGAALVIIQHLDPSHPSSLVELLGRQSPIPISEAKEGIKVQPDHAYIIPPGKAMSIHDRTLNLQEQQEHPGLTHSVNLFFRSLAEDVKEGAVGIILSGTGNDGTEGARAIKAREGLVLVQDPATAKYDGMPRAAIESGVADYVLSPEGMPDKLIEYLHQSFYQRYQTRQSLKKDDPALKNILSLVKARTGRDFSGYKISSITRRVEHRMAVNSIATAGNYLKFVRGNPTEIENLMKDFLIQVTSFLRDKEAFEALKREIGRTLKSRPEGSSLRAWVPGCSTGEEAYSLAMIILECVLESGRRYEVQVFGTDLDAEAIAIARAGVYPASIVQDVSSERLERFFSRGNSSYQIKKNVRECVVFAVHDLVADPPYSRVDIVSMRNLLIYFDADLQNKILPMLHYSLNEGGLLFLGTSETIGDHGDLFTTVDGKWRIYRSLGKNKAFLASFSTQPRMYETGAAKLPKTRTSPGLPPEPILLLEALPPSVLVDRNYKVLYTHGDTSKYLRMSEGKPSAIILDLVKPQLGSVLAALLHEASKEQKELVSDNLHIRNNGGTQPVKISVRPLSTLEGNMIVTFEDLPRRKARKATGAPAAEAQHQALEQELLRTRDTLRETIEELKTANEELRSANEEYMSANEELKSANEELETSREELQSVNEELTTLNSESQRKNEDLTTINNDMLNLLNATGASTVFLDDRLRIRRFTPAATRLFRFIDSDIGRPVEDISSPLNENVLVEAARAVLDKLIPVEQEVQTTSGHWYTLRIVPYRTTDNNIAGVVVSFADIDKVKVALQYAENIVNNLREPLLVLDDELEVISASQAFYQTFQVKPEDTVNQLIYDLGNRQWDIPELRKILKEVTEKHSVFEGYRVEHDFPVIGHRVMLLNARRIFSGQGETQSVLLAMEDITGRAGLEPFSQRKGPSRLEGLR